MARFYVVDHQHLIFSLSKTASRLEENKRNSLEFTERFENCVICTNFRNDHGFESYNLNYIDLTKSLEARFGGKWSVIVRLHPIISSKKLDIEYNNVIINGSLYPQIEDLISISDVMITDFSGCMFDGFRLKKIILLYAPDYEEYIQNERKLYFDLTELPSSLSKTNEELHENIRTFEMDVYKKKLEDFLNSIHYYPGGHAAEQIVDRIDMVINS